MKRYFELKDKKAVIGAVILLVLGAVFSMFCIQYLLLEWELFMKTSDEMLFLNVVCCLVLYLFIQLFTNSVALTCIISHILLILFAFIDYFVYEFRGNEFSFADITSASTGLSVAGKYNFSINNRCIVVIIASIIFIIIVSRFRIHFEKRILISVIDILIMIVCCIIVIYNSMYTITETWEKKGTYRNGYILNFLLEIRDSFVSEPDGYSTEVVEQLEKEYTAKDSSHSQSDVSNPTIITIMSESFADLRVIGDFSTNMPVTPFMNSLKENTIRGYALSSVYGAKTPNSEWEFLTGNSMAFLPDGSVVYQQYIDKQPSTLVTTLKDHDYTCVAMHPYYASGWNRSTIYPNMGFDETYFIDDFDQSNILRDYIKDEELFDKVIDRYEKKKDNENLFIMGITMQNHGGFGEPYDNFDEQVHKLGRSYTDANQYLSLLHESDKALKKLITYFEKQDEPVEIVFFGDHQPGLYNEFIKLLNNKGVTGLTLEELENLYKVPFFIWTNYDTQEQQIDTTSINYLSTLALERANIDLPPYNQFLADMMEQIPAINSRGYYSKEENKFIHIDEAIGNEKKWINNYNILQYNCMFDEERSNKFFPYYKGEK